MKRCATSFIAVHCSATPPDMDIGAAEIREWHVRDNGWDDIGYHFVICRDGTIERGRALDEVGAHIAGFNGVSIGVCLVGGVTKAKEPDDNFTYEQWQMLTSLVIALHLRYPTATVMGHRDFPGVTKACPCFDVKPWWKQQKEAVLDAILKTDPGG